jgi:predicted AAA+ superfamily ATPase
MKRYLQKYIKDDLKNKMVFIGGPRQVGKTTLALSLSGVDTPLKGSRFSQA